MRGWAVSALKKTQRQRILDLLLSARGREVPSVALSRISLQYGARVKELRELGFKIQNRTERRSDKVCGYFRLQSGAGKESHEPIKAASATLFGNLSPDRSYAE